MNLTIVDQVGHTNSTSVTVEIVNQRPTAALRIDGVPTDDERQFDFLMMAGP